MNAIVDIFNRVNEKKSLQRFIADAFYLTQELSKKVYFNGLYSAISNLKEFDIYGK